MDILLSNIKIYLIKEYNSSHVDMMLTSISLHIFQLLSLYNFLESHEIYARALIFMTSFECFDRQNIKKGQFSLLQTPISLKRGR